MTRQDCTNRKDIEKRIAEVREDLMDGSALQSIRKVAEYMEAHFDQNLTLELLASKAKLSVSRLAHRFKERTNSTLIEYLTWLRIVHAQRMLSETEQSCMKIADEIGYNNQSYFSRTFRRVTGMTPRQYRRKAKGGKVAAKRK